MRVTVHSHSSYSIEYLWIIQDDYRNYTLNHFTSCSSPYSRCGGLPPGGPPPPLTGGGSDSSCGEGKEKDKC